MKKLEMYKKLPQEDKDNLTIYNIYNAIYIIAKNQNYPISDEEVERIEELTHYVYLKDEYYNLSESKIADFLSECYIINNTSIDVLEDTNWSDILEAVDNNNYDFCREEMER